jgi:hypothetical protein
VRLPGVAGVEQQALDGGEIAAPDQDVEIAELPDLSIEARSVVGTLQERRDSNGTSWRKASLTEADRGATHAPRIDAMIMSIVSAQALSTCGVNFSPSTTFADSRNARRKAG